MEIRTLEGVLRSYALGFPETYEEFPWGERAIKVKGKTIAFMRAEPGEFSMSTKLPQSRDFALSLPFTEPTHYGLGKSGWVTSRFTVGDDPPLETLRAWLRESYMAVAPKKLAAQLETSGEDPQESAPEIEVRQNLQRQARAKSKKSSKRVKK